MKKYEALGIATIATSLCVAVQNTPGTHGEQVDLQKSTDVAKMPVEPNKRVRVANDQPCMAIPVLLITIESVSIAEEKSEFVLSLRNTTEMPIQTSVFGLLAACGHAVYVNDAHDVVSLFVLDQHVLLDPGPILQDTLEIIPGQIITHTVSIGRPFSPCASSLDKASGVPLKQLDLLSHDSIIHDKDKPRIVIVGGPGNVRVSRDS